MSSTARRLPWRSIEVAIGATQGPCPDDLLHLVRAVEEHGFDGVWLSQCRHGPPEGHPGGLLCTLGWLTQHTTRLMLGALVEVPGRLHPAVLAKNITTLDVLSGGRMVLGLVPSSPVEAAAAATLVDALAICRLMFTRPSATYAGKSYRVAGALNRPAPVSVGGPAIAVSTAAPPPHLHDADALIQPAPIAQGTGGSTVLWRGSVDELDGAAVEGALRSGAQGIIGRFVATEDLDRLADVIVGQRPASG